MGRPRTVPRTPAERALYQEMMAQLGELKERQRNRLTYELHAALMELYAPKARAILVNALTDPKLTPEERHKLAIELVTETGDEA
jgi:hypothetical protein